MRGSVQEQKVCDVCMPQSEWCQGNVPATPVRAIGCRWGCACHHQVGMMLACCAWVCMQCRVCCCLTRSPSSGESAPSPCSTVACSTAPSARSWSSLQSRQLSLHLWTHVRHGSGHAAHASKHLIHTDTHSALVCMQMCVLKALLVQLQCSAGCLTLD